MTEVYKTGQLYNEDCLQAMKRLPDNYFDLALSDPPYFEAPKYKSYYGHKVSPIGVNRVYKKSGCWEVPSKEYFEELLRVSKNQIVFGINYFDVNLGPGRIVWDKCCDSSTFSDCEIAYCSFHNKTRIFRYMWNGMNQGKSISEGHIMQGNKALNEQRIHPTQKPVNLYKWILMEYAKEGDVILDTHVGSASSIIACKDLGFDYMGFEIDKNYYSAAMKRLDEYDSQIKFDFTGQQLRI